jgi:transposase
MPRFRLDPTLAQAAVLRGHCDHARFVWNLAVEQHAWWRPGRGPAPRFVERVTLDRAGRWHVAFAAIPAPIPAPGNGQVVGVDRGVAVSAALSNGELLTVPGLASTEAERLARLRRRLARARPGSRRRERIRIAIARLKARETDRCKDWAEKTSTHLARSFDVIAIEDLRIAMMTRSAKGTVERPGRNVAAKAGLNRGILASDWGLLARRPEQKAPGRVVKVNSAYTSQTCHRCGNVDGSSRESQARFVRGGSLMGRPVNREPQLVLAS